MWSLFFKLDGFGITSTNIDETTIEITYWVENGSYDVVEPPTDYETVSQCSSSGDFPDIPPNAQMTGGGAGGDGGRFYNCAVEVSL